MGPRLVHPPPPLPVPVVHQPAIETAPDPRRERLFDAFDAFLINPMEPPTPPTSGDVECEAAYTASEQTGQQTHPY
ncbi:hypothetical protein A0H81_12912 [Grifola frondosa]|uniref:Uncharacterized protein n=1 Tax=Grifola frondosa TaxID=5627 RepID=A0A1C7LQZ4_GRIFR|nr:hypothetical protein A0H81_12912 [Grifola frondosa]